MNLLWSRIREVGDWPYAVDSTRTAATILMLCLLAMLTNGAALSLLWALYAAPRLGARLTWAEGAVICLCLHMLTLRPDALGRGLTQARVRRRVRGWALKASLIPLTLLALGGLLWGVR